MKPLSISPKIFFLLLIVTLWFLLTRPFVFYWADNLLLAFLFTHPSHISSEISLFWFWWFQNLFPLFFFFQAQWIIEWRHLKSIIYFPSTPTLSTAPHRCICSQFSLDSLYIAKASDSFRLMLLIFIFIQSYLDLLRIDHFLENFY